MSYRGRFAPTPSGDLHFGSLVAALGSFLQAKSQGGKWFVRIDDLDTPRVVPGASDQILHTLERYGFQWDDSILYQSQQTEVYQAALETIGKGGQTYRCYCSRKKIMREATRGVEGFLYPGTCRNVPESNQPIRSVRIETDGVVIDWDDGLYGQQSQDLSQDIGDFALWRGDGVFSYHLANVVDDFDQGITEVVRGSDLLGSTARQVFLQDLLNYPRPAYLHLPVAIQNDGRKLSKQNRAPTLPSTHINRELFLCLVFLDQNPPAELESEPIGTILQWAIQHWNRHHIEACLTKDISTASQVTISQP